VRRKDNFPWWNLAECRGMNTDLFFSSDEFSTRRAKQACEVCRVRKPCLEKSLEETLVFIDAGMEQHDQGIRCGIGPEERAELLRLICPGTVGHDLEVTE
jgi:hypothetical protein